MTNAQTSPRISVVALGVSNVTRAKAFYEGMGWTVAPSSTDRLVYFLSGGVMLALYDQVALAGEAAVTPRGEGFDRITLSQNVSTKDEVAQTLVKASQLGGRVTRSARDTTWGGHAGWFSDPDEHLWEIVWNPHWVMDSDGRVSPPK